MLSTIFSYEWKQFIRSKGLIIASFIFIGIGFFCLQQGKAIYDFQKASVDSALVKKQRSFNKVKQVFDTLTYKSDKRNSIEEPFVLEWQLKDVVAKQLSPLSVLSIGQLDVFTPLASGHFNGDIFKNVYTEFQNPEKLLAGNLDTAFFVLFLFPLLFIALSYNIQSADKEAGITPILVAHVGFLIKIIYLRLFFRYLIALVPLFFVALAAYMQLSGLINFNTSAFFQWWAVVFIYTLFWLIVVAFIQRLQFSSLINAITLAGIWVLLLIIIPGLLNTWYNYKYPSTNKTEIAEYRDYDFKAWDKPTAEHKKFLFSQYPQLIKDAARIDSNGIRSFSYSLQVYKKEQELYERITAQKNKLASSEQSSFWINPVGGVMRSFAVISLTTLQQHQQFEQAVLAYRLQKLTHIYENQVTQLHFTKANFEALPKYNQPASYNNSFVFLFPTLAFAAVLLIMILIMSFRKNRL